MLKQQLCIYIYNLLICKFIYIYSIIIMFYLKKTGVLLNVFVETMILFSSILLSKIIKNSKEELF